MKFYRVTFDIKCRGEQGYVIDIEADNTKQARAKAEEMWEDWYKNSTKTPHMFHLTVRRLKDTEEFLYNFFKKN